MFVSIVKIVGGNKEGNDEEEEEVEVGDDQWGFRSKQDRLVLSECIWVITGQKRDGDYEKYRGEEEIEITILFL